MTCCQPCAYPPINPYLCNVQPICNPAIAQEGAVWPTNVNAATEPAWCTISKSGICSPSSILAVTPSDPGTPGIYNKLSIQLSPQCVEGCPYTASICVVVQGTQMDAAGNPVEASTIRAYRTTICFYNGCPATAEIVFSEASTPIYYYFGNTTTSPIHVARVDISIIYNGC